MRFLLSIIISLIAMQMYSQQVSQRVMDFGKVKLWNNPSFEVEYTNTSGRTQLFLPIRYSPEVGVRAAQQKLAPGESTTLTLTYYTEDFGRFSKSVAVYVSTQDNPITFELKGNILSFHPDAFTVCPSVEPADQPADRGFIHTIKVVDASTRLPLKDFQIEIVTRSSKESLFSDNSTIQLRRDVPGFYTFNVDKEHYEIQNIDKYVNRSSVETVIALVPEEVVSDENTENFDWNTEDSAEQVIDIEEPNLAQTENDNVPVVEDSLDTITIEEQVDEEVERSMTTEVVDTADYDQNGTLSENKYVFNHIIFLIDVSSSMKKADKLPLLKQSMLQMIQVLRPEDKVSIITYGTTANVQVEAVSGADKAQLTGIIDALVARGQSYGADGVDMAYDLAKANAIVGGNNEIILASDGVFNSRNFKEHKLYTKSMVQHRLYSIRMSTIGFGNASKALNFLETLADRGEGSFLRITSDVDAESALIENLMKHSIR